MPRNGVGLNLGLFFINSPNIGTQNHPILDIFGPNPTFRGCRGYDINQPYRQITALPAHSAWLIYRLT